MAAHRYWRLYITANNGSTYTALMEIEMRATAGGSDQCSGGSAIYSSQYPGQGAANAFDNNSATNWASDGSAAPHYIGYDFGSAVSVAQIAVTGMGAGAYATQNIRDFKVQFSDDTFSWYDVAVYSGVTSWADGETKLYNAYLGTLAGNITESSAVADWVVSAIRCSDGVYVGSENVSGSSYSIDVPTTQPCSIVLAPRIDYAWTASKVVALNDCCVPSNPESTPRLYKASSIGSSPHQTHASTEPTWPTSGTVSDNDITWTFITDLDDSLFQVLGAKVPS